jgi:multidrug efflux pump subunit AcrA (membrane-fusion protein)
MHESARAHTQQREREREQREASKRERQRTHTHTHKERGEGGYSHRVVGLLLRALDERLEQTGQDLFTQVALHTAAAAAAAAVAEARDDDDDADADANDDDDSIRVRVEITGSQKCRIVGKSQPVLMMINPMIFTRTRGGCRSGCLFPITFIAADGGG